MRASLGCPRVPDPVELVGLAAFVAFVAFVAFAVLAAFVAFVAFAAFVALVGLADLVGMIADRIEPRVKPRADCSAGLWMSAAPVGQTTGTGRSAAA